jgi:predicted negative regulator of RcsB-dependent stress response
VDDLLSEKEQIEEMRAWWRGNGRYVISGVVLGVGILFGWNQWKDHRQSTRLEASTRYEALANEVGDGDLEAAETAAAELYENYASTPYAALARLAMARLYMDKGRDQDAADTLKALLAERDNAELQMVGRLRLAKIYLYQDKPEQVVELLSGFEDTAFSARYDEILGDAYTALGRVADAAAAYGRAMADNPGEPTVNRSLIQMKMVDLPDEAVVIPEEVDEAAAGDASSDASGDAAPDDMDPQ